MIFSYRETFLELSIIHVAKQDLWNFFYFVQTMKDKLEPAENIISFDVEDSYTP